MKFRWPDDPSGRSYMEVCKDRDIRVVSFEETRPPNASPMDETCGTVTVVVFNAHTGRTWTCTFPAFGYHRPQEWTLV